MKAQDRTRRVAEDAGAEATPIIGRNQGVESNESL